MNKFTARIVHRSHHDDDARRALTADLAGYTSPTDLLELAAILHRHRDTDTAEVRDLLDWTRAA